MDVDCRRVFFWGGVVFLQGLRLLVMIGQGLHETDAVLVTCRALRLREYGRVWGCCVGAAEISDIA